MNDNLPWFSEGGGFFDQEYLDESEETLSNERTLLEVDFIEKTLDLRQGASILDIPCGHGRHSIELAKRGYDVTGVDLNGFFLSVAQTAADQADLAVQFQQCDMRAFDSIGQFDVAINLFTAMGYFDRDEDDLEFLARVHRSLKPGGQFLLDFINRNWLIRNFRPKDWYPLPDEAFLLVERELDHIRGLNLEHRTKVTSGVAGKTRTSSLRVYTANELVTMAEKVGFTFQEAFGDFSGSPLGLNSRSVVLRFQKS